MRSLLTIALFAILGVTAAFFKAAVPHQVPNSKFQLGEAGAASTSAAFDDEGLDNPNIVSDKNIHPARKCGFCIG